MADNKKMVEMNMLIKSAERFGASDEEINAAMTLPELRRLERQYRAMSTERTGGSSLFPAPPPKRPTKKEPKLGHGGMAMKKPEMMKGGMYKGKKHMYAAGGMVKEIKM